MTESSRLLPPPHDVKSSPVATVPTYSQDVINFFEQAYRSTKRYWHRDHPPYSVDPASYGPNSLTGELLTWASSRQTGRALDLGGGEGGDAIRLALLGYEVDVIEGTPAGSEKIEDHAREVGVTLTVINANLLGLEITRQYDVVVCNGVLHYIDPADKVNVLRHLSDATVPGGLNAVSLFTTHTALPEEHRAIPVFPDEENGLVQCHYSSWTVRRRLIQRDKIERSHRDFKPHRHSFLKLLVEKSASATSEQPAERMTG